MMLVYLHDFIGHGLQLILEYCIFNCEETFCGRFELDFTPSPGNIVELISICLFARHNIGMQFVTKAQF